MATDPFYRLETEAKDIQKAKEEKTRLHDIMDLQQNRANDDYELNAQLRKKFRIEKKQIETKDKTDKEYKNFALPLPEVTMADKLAAKKAKFRGLDPFRLNELMKKEKIRTESIFKSSKNNHQETLMKTSKWSQSTKHLLKEAIERRAEPNNILGTKISAISKTK